MKRLTALWLFLSVCLGPQATFAQTGQAGTGNNKRISAECLRGIESDTKRSLSKTMTPDSTSKIAMTWVEDLNNDKIKDLVATYFWACSAKSCENAIFLSRDSCWNMSGHLAGNLRKIGLRSTKGAKVLTASWSMGCSGAERIETTYEFDGSQYVKIKAKSINECSTK